MSWLGDYWRKGDVFDRLFLIGLASVATGVLGLIFASAVAADEAERFAPGAKGALEDMNVETILERARREAGEIDLAPESGGDLTWDPHGAASANVLQNPEARAALEAMLGLEPGSAGLPASQRQKGSNLLVFVSFSMPDDALRQLGHDATKAGASLVLQGFLGGSAIDMAEAIHRVFGENTEVGFAVDPTAFNRFGVTTVPTVIALEEPLVSCKTRFCSEDERPPHDRIAGNASLAFMLEAISERGDAGRFAASDALARLRIEE